MELLDKYNRLKLENKGFVAFIQVGVFYVAIGIDAYILNEILGLKLTKFSHTEKVGIPVNSIDKYEIIMQEYDIPYVFMSKDGEIVARFEGSFDFVEKNEKLRAFFEIFYAKDEVLNAVKKLEESTNIKFRLGDFL